MTPLPIRLGWNPADGPRPARPSYEESHLETQAYVQLRY